MIPKKLAQFVMPSAETTVYVVPASTSTMLKEILVANTSASAQTVSLSLVPAGAVANYTNRILPDVSLGPNAMATFNFSTVMATGDFLSARASAASAVTMTISGLESPGTGTSSGTTEFASVGMVVTSTSRPTNPYNGQTIYETDTDRLMTWDGATWEPMNVPIVTSGTRPSAIDGQLIYETDTDRLLAYDGSGWDPMNIPITTSGARPASSEGQVIFETDTDLLKFNNGSSWVTVTNFRMFGVGSALTGSVPAIDTGSIPFKFQGGTLVAATNASGDVSITFPVAFPNGVVTVSIVQGDVTHPGATFIPYGVATNAFSYRMYQSNGAAWTNSGNHRVDWLAIGW